MTAAGQPVSLVAELTALPGCEERVHELVRGLVPEVRAEPGNDAFHAWRRTERPAEYVVFETYADRDAFEAHLATSHREHFDEQIAGLVEGGGSRLTWLTPVLP